MPSHVDVRKGINVLFMCFQEEEKKAKQEENDLVELRAKRRSLRNIR